MKLLMRLASVLVLLGMRAGAQTSDNYLLHLSNGAEVVYQVFSLTNPGRGLHPQSEVKADGNTVRHIFYDQSGNAVEGFVMQIELLSATTSPSIVVTFSPANGLPMPSSLPPTQTIKAGDRILLPEYVNPVGNVHVADLIQIGVKGTMLQVLPLAKSLPTVPTSTLALTFDNPTVQVETGIKRDVPGMVSGKHLRFYSSEFGIVSISSEPLPGYTLSGIASGNKLTLAFGAKFLNMKSTTPIASIDGTWAVWAKTEPSTSGFKQIEAF